MFAYVPNTNNRYMASTYGRIYDFKMKKYMNIQVHKQGWCRAHFHINGIRKTVPWHRIIMTTFMGDSDLTVNHINGNKKNNSIYNLEYATNKEQAIHRNREIQVGNFKRIYCVETGDIFLNAVVAAEKLNIPKTSIPHIRRVAKGEYGFKSAHNYTFKPVD